MLVVASSFQVNLTGYTKFKDFYVTFDVDIDYSTLC